MGDEKFLVRRPKAGRGSPVDGQNEDAVRVRMPIQRKLVVGAANDPFETEADQLADRAMRLLSSSSRDSASHEVQAAPITRISRRSTVGSAGGDVDAETEHAIDRARSGGEPLEGELRRSMEGAFGSDFSGVRVHVGADSDELNHRVQAKAFTTGSDIFVRRQDYAPRTSSGQRLLAHELAHTVQQKGGQHSGGAAQRTIRRLAVDKPLKKITSIEVFQTGASGKVAEVSDGGKSVVVKVDQQNAAEVIAADRLARKGGAASGKFKVKAPRSRIATAADLLELQNKAADPNVMKQADPRNFITGLGGANPTLIAERMEGDRLSDSLTAGAGKTKTTDAATKKTTTDYNPDAGMVAEIKKLVKSTAPVKALAKGQASDIAMGMGDRILGLWNPENFLFNPKTKRFAFVDNTQNQGAGYLVTNSVQGARESFEEWLKLGMVQKLVGDIDALAAQFVSKFTGLDTTGQNFNDGGILYAFTGQGAKYNASPTKTAYDELLAIIQGNWASLVDAAKAGLTAGKATVIKELGSAAKLTAGVPAGARLEAATSLLARQEVLKGGNADTAWLTGGLRARKALGMPAMPTLPAIPPPNPNANRGNGGSNGIGGGTGATKGRGKGKAKAKVKGS